MENGLEEYLRSTRQRLCTIVVLLLIPPKYQSTKVIDANTKTPTQTLQENNTRTYLKDQGHRILPDREPQRLQQGKET